MEQCQLIPAVHLLPHLYITVPEVWVLVLFFFFLPTGKKKLWLSQINLRNATEIDDIMISLWLLLIFATVHILSPSNSILLSELGYLIHSQYKRQEKELYKNIKHAARLGPNLIYSHSRWSNNVQIRFMQQWAIWRSDQQCFRKRESHEASKMMLCGNKALHSGAVFAKAFFTFNSNIFLH